MKAFLLDVKKIEVVILDFAETSNGSRVKVTFKDNQKRSFWAPTEKIVLE